MAECTQWFSAEDVNGKPLPFAARFKFYELKGSEFVDSGLYGVLPGSPFAMKVDSSKRYKVVPLDEVIQSGKLVTLSGWVIPSAETFNGCAIDIKFVYKKIICTPMDTKCVGDAVHKCVDDGTEWSFLKNCPGGCKNGECLEVPVRKPEITAVGTKETPKLCEPVQFESRFDYNDSGWKDTDQGTGTRRTLWEYSKDDKEWDSECADELNWSPFSDETWPLHTFSEDYADIRHIRHTVKNKYDETACAIISHFRFADSSGFVITVDPALAGKPLIVWHVVKVPHPGPAVTDPNLYFAAFAFVRGTWNSASSDKVYKVQVGDIRTTANPTFDEMSLGTLYDGQLRDGFDCVILARESPSSMNFGFFKKEDVFKLHSDEPTCVDLVAASNDVLTEAIMGPVCDLFKIPRGPECESFWAEFYDPVFVANYASIVKTGKDTLGNERELTVFDHLALPFAILGVVAPNLPFGKFVSEGLKGLWKGGKMFSEAAFNWMGTVAINTPADKIVSGGPWTFMQSIVRISGDHLDEVMELIHKDDFVAAASKLEEYLASDIGNVPYREFTDFNDALREYLSLDQWEMLMDTIYGYAPQADSILKTTSKTSPTADDLADIAAATKHSGIMDEATAAILNSIKNLDTASVELINELKNVLKNTPELSAKLVAKHKSVLDGVVSGGDISKIYVRTILNHAELIPGDIVALFRSIDPSIVSKLSDGTYKQVLGNFIDSNLKHYDVVKALGDLDADKWVKNNVDLSRKALDSADPAKMADIPHSIFEGIDDAAPLIDDLPGTSAADELIDTAEEFAEEATTSWRERGLNYIDKIVGSLFRKAKGAPKDTVHYADSTTRYAKWKSIYRNLEDWQKFTFWTMVVWGTYETLTFFGGFVIPKILGIFPGQASGRQIGHNENMQAAGWQCKSAWDYRDTEKLEDAVGVLEKAINDAEDHLNANKKEFKLNKEYNGFANAIEAAKLVLADYKDKLATLVPLGTIRFTSNQTGFAIYIDGKSEGTSYGETFKVIENVNAGDHTVKIEKGANYSPDHCEELIKVIADKITTFDCQMTHIVECAEVTNVKIYIDPLSPIKGQKVAFNGSADSYDTIEETGWVWNFGDGSTEASGQAVTHKYSKPGTYTAKLTVTNTCGELTSSTRVITVKAEEEEPTEESCTLLVREPIDPATGKNCTRSYLAEIYVDNNTIGKETQFSIPFGTNDKIGGYGGQCGVPHDIKVVLVGYEDTEKRFTIEADELKEWQPEMVKKTVTNTGFVECKTEPTDAEIFIGGTYYGDTNKTIELSPGQHWIVFTKDGYEDCDKPVTVVKGTTITAECVLKAIAMHTVEITVPDGAKLFVDDKEISVTQVARLSTVLRELRR